jgi:hypothetical protein
MTKYRKTARLLESGFQGDVLKSINCAVDYSSFDKNLIPPNSEDGKWINDFALELKAKNLERKKAGLQVFYHIDFFVFPKLLVEKYKNQICDKDGIICMEKPLTLKLVEIMFDEIQEKFPEIDGFIIRVGETYLYDYPYHMGNGPIRNAEYENPIESRELEISRYVRFINLTKGIICNTYNKTLLFRTWDCYPDKFHADPNYYLEVSDQIEPHEKFYFSIKHTALDFWRHVKFNPCLGIGKHKQVVEVQCQREYEGKGAYPMYIMHHLINGFSECKEKKGLKDFVNNELYSGIFSWSRGGGWYGPYIQNEFWCDLNTTLISRYANNSAKTEKELFEEYFLQLGFNEKERITMRSLCLNASEGVLKGQYCTAYDVSLEERITPTNLWMRDDRLGGLDRLHCVFTYLAEHDKIDEALREKEEAVKLWKEVCILSEQLKGTDDTREYIRTSSNYGRLLYSIVATGWSIMAETYRKSPNKAIINKKLGEYNGLWNEYETFGRTYQCATLYSDKYFNLPGTEQVPGMGASIRKIAKEFMKD